MTNGPIAAAHGHVVSFHYTLSLDDQEIVDSSEGEEPLEYLHGYNQIISGLEKALEGMVADEEKDVVVSPGDAYGDIDPDAFKAMPLESFPADLELEPGMGFHMRNVETDELVEVFVSEIRQDDVLLSFNHPLAGETLHFHVQLVDVRPATSEELAHGHAHGAGHEH